MSSELSWQARQTPPPLAENIVHLWRCELLATPAELAHEFSLLNLEEQQRAQRFLFPEHQQRFTLAHSFLRQVLSAYTGQTAKTLEFMIDPQGKPHLADKALEFNLSHSEEYALLALTAAKPIGVDIECERARDIRALAENHFSPLEIKALFALAPEEQVHAFFRVWTQKEAFVKALGQGLSFPLESFSVLHTPSGGMLQLPPGETTRSWHLQSFNTYPGFQAAFAIPGSVTAIHAFNFEFI